MPKLKWTREGGRAVIEEIREMSRARESHNKTVKETTETTREFDRVARSTWKNQATDMEKYRRAAEAVNQAVNTQRNVTREMANKELRRLKEEYLGTGEAARKAAAEQVAAQKQAAAALKSIRTAQDRYNEQMLQTQRLRKSGLLTDAQAITLVRRHKEELHVASGAAREEAEAEKARADAVAEAGRASAQASRVAAAAEKERAAALAKRAQQEERLNALRAQSRERGVGRGMAASATAQAERNRLTREGAAAMRAVETAQEKYNASLLETQRLRKAGAISDAQAIRLVRHHKEELAKAGQAHRETFGAGAIAQVRNYALGVGGVMAAVGEARAEYERFREAVERRSQTQTTAADARRSLRDKIQPFDPAIRDRVTAAADRIASGVSLPSQLVDQTFQAGISASSDPDKAIPYMEFALRATRDESAAELAGSLQDVGSALGGEAAGITPEIAFGFTNLFAARSRIEDRGKAARELPKVLQSGKSFGLDPYESAALYGALTNSTVDPFGAVTRTSTQNLVAGLEGFFDEDRLNRFGIKAEDADTSRERLALVLSDPEGLGKEASETIKGFRGASIGGVRALLQGFSGSGMEVYGKLTDELQDFGKLKATGADALAYIEGGLNEPTARSGQVAESFGEQTSLRSSSVALSQEDKAAFDLGLRNLRRAYGGTNVGSEYRRWLAVGAEVTPTEAADLLERELSAAEFQVRLGDRAQQGDLAPAYPGSRPAPIELSSAQRAEFDLQAETTRQAIEGFRRAAQLQEQAAEALYNSAGAGGSSRQE